MYPGYPGMDDTYPIGAAYLYRTNQAAVTVACLGATNAKLETTSPALVQSLATQSLRQIQGLAGAV